MRHPLTHVFPLQQNDEVLFLPPIVDAAESSPTAAAESARIIRKYLAKEYSSRPSWQYNAIMLMRILADNPGETFTRNMDAKFVDTARALLKGTKDNNVRQILMDTLEEFERAKFYDTNLTFIISMWQEEKDKAVEKHGVRDGQFYGGLFFSLFIFIFVAVVVSFFWLSFIDFFFFSLFL